jgi:Spy/CpxP family protein refolding chaperone
MVDMIRIISAGAARGYGPRRRSATGRPVMIRLARLAAGLALLALAVGPAAAEGCPRGPCPYAGFQGRPIKALSAEQLADLKEGRGMMLSLPAELNGYPGPRHVIELAEQLGLGAEQRAAAGALIPAMTEEAKAIGTRIVASEAALDRLFAERRADEAAVRAAAGDVASLWGDLRYVHLKYHLRAAALLTPEQIARYSTLRGYAGTLEGAAGGHPHRH